MSRAPFSPPFAVGDAMNAAMRAYHDAAALCSKQQSAHQGRPATPDDFIQSFEQVFMPRLRALPARGAARSGT